VDAEAEKELRLVRQGSNVVAAARPQELLGMGLVVRQAGRRIAQPERLSVFDLVTMSHREEQKERPLRPGERVQELKIRANGARPVLDLPIETDPQLARKLLA